MIERDNWFSEHVPADVMEARQLMASATKRQQEDFDRWLAKQPKQGAA